MELLFVPSKISIKRTSTMNVLLHMQCIPIVLTRSFYKCTDLLFMDIYESITTDAIETVKKNWL